MSLRREPVAYRKAIRAASLPWNQRLEQRAAASDKQARSPRRLLEQPAEAAHRFHPVFSHKHLMNHDKLLRRFRSSSSHSGFAVSMARSCSVGSTGSPVVSSRGGKILLLIAVGDLVVGPSLGDVRSIAELTMQRVIAHHGIATNLDGEEPC